MTATNTHLYLVDPANRVGKLALPATAILPTKGSDLYYAQYPGGRTIPTDPNGKCSFSLCMLYQKRKCRSGVNCHQIHADRQLVAQVRAQAKRSNCCSQHAAEVPAAVFASAPSCFTEVYNQVHAAANNSPLCCVLSLNSGAQQHVLPVSNFGRTAGLDALVVMGAQSKKALLHIPMARVCRLHQQHQCHYGKDCHNIHLCRNVWKELCEAGTQEDDCEFTYHNPEALQILQRNSAGMQLSAVIADKLAHQPLNPIIQPQGPHPSLMSPNGQPPLPSKERFKFTFPSLRSRSDTVSSTTTTSTDASSGYESTVGPSVSFSIDSLDSELTDSESLSQPRTQIRRQATGALHSGVDVDEDLWTSINL
eukprot:TRINITY_DN67708_c5_g3_i2.p1 TRINITY_DN67708_c5_g3~~TRINITY_DN67708_c5_g3_i2.p1  ORF type:complete len:365 (-),score=19.05 TRINITY_DN67708_c5_g3_i2:1147-2241(-)